jgi:UDP-N-acetylmuramoyl-tripeptide--D-alanyl-D-alanine ligase
MPDLEISELYKLYLRHLSVQTDTRKLKQGDIFFALKGPNFNGNTFAEKALDMGAAYTIIDDPGYHANDKCIVVDNVLEALQQLAKYHRQQFNIPFIAITGSNGKTTTKELVTAVLQRKYRTYATEGNLNNHIGVPLTLLKIRNDAEMAVIEMGANHLKEIESYCQIALPTHGLITNCGKAHIEGFGSEEGVRKGKGELYDFIRANNGIIFRNTDLPYLEEMANGIAKQVTYGSNNATYVGRLLKKGVLLSIELMQPETTINTNLVGDYNFPNVMAAVTAGLHFDVAIEDIKYAIANYNPDNSRSQWLRKGTNKIILDAYNANPTSMRAAISNFAGLDLKDKTLWIGAMKEMGAAEVKEHEELVRFIEEHKWKDVILVGIEFSPIKTSYRKFDTSADAANYIRNNQPHDASILIKGSRGSKMELMLEAIK